jgi:hypothetical protein
MSDNEKLDITITVQANDSPALYATLKWYQSNETQGAILKKFAEAHALHRLQQRDDAGEPSLAGVLETMIAQAEAADDAFDIAFYRYMRSLVI